MLETSRRPLVHPICLAPGRLDALRAKNGALSNLQRELDGYLETKRVIFPRFYFLTNEEIVLFLASVRQPEKATRCRPFLSCDANLSRQWQGSEVFRCRTPRQSVRKCLIHSSKRL